MGDPLDEACGFCPQIICGQDPSCCTVEWGADCVEYVGSLCGQSCEPPDAGAPDAGSGIAPGDLVITEVMNAPVAVDEAKGEWFEVHNPTAKPIEMQGLAIRHQLNDPNVVQIINASLVVPAGGYVVLGLNADAATNGGVKVDYVYSGIAMTTKDVLAIQTNTSPPVVIDQTTWDAASGLDPKGASRSLDPAFASAAQNDDDTHWCAAPAAIPGGAGDKGSPGAKNPPCP